MSTDFKKILVKDSRLMVTDQLAYAVKKGGQSIVSQVASAIAQSTTSVNFNVQIPSEQTIVDRRVFVKSTVLIQFQVTSPSFNQLPALNYGNNIALSAFPFHQLASTVQATLNNNVTSINIKDVLPFLTRSNDSRELQKSMSSCPTLPDKFYFNSDDMGASGQLASFTENYPNGFDTVQVVAPPPGSVNGTFNSGGIDSDILPNGAFAGYGAPLNAPNVGVEAPVTLFYSTSNTPAGPWVALNQTVITNPPTPAPGQGNGRQPGIRANWYQLQFTTIEPVLCQPFLWSNPSSNTQGIYGLQTLQLQYNLTDPNRCFRLVDGQINAGTFVVANSTIVSVTNSQLIFKYITPHPSDLLPARNVIPLMTYDRYFSNASNTLLNADFGTGQITSNTYNLTQVPDKICIFLRKKQTTQRPTDTDWSPVIQNISLNWNNNAGLLSSATLQDLYTYSVNAGSNQSFQQFCGQAYSNNSSWLLPNASQNGYASKITTVGSYLMLNFADVIQLTEDFYSPGSLGNFQLQFQLTIANQSPVAVPANSLEIVLVVVNSGIMVTDRGQTSTYTGILTKQDVLDASQTEPISNHDVKRIVGSGMMDSGRALPMKVCDMLRRAKDLPAKAVEVAKEAVSKMSKRLM
jgi:hypothetical protein